jgi:hypothetical protein
LRNPPPPVVAWVLVANVIMVPALTVVLSVAVHELPAAAVVVQLIMADPTVQVALAVLGVTENRLQVIAVPAYEKISMLGLHVAGATTVTSAFSVPC